MLKIRTLSVRYTAVTKHMLPCQTPFCVTKLSECEMQRLNQFDATEFNLDASSIVWNVPGSQIVWKGGKAGE